MEDTGKLFLATSFADAYILVHGLFRRLCTEERTPACRPQSAVRETRSAATVRSTSYATRFSVIPLRRILRDRPSRCRRDLVRRCRNDHGHATEPAHVLDMRVAKQNVIGFQAFNALPPLAGVEVLK